MQNLVNWDMIFFLFLDAVAYVSLMADSYFCATYLCRLWGPELSISSAAGTLHHSLTTLTPDTVLPLKLLILITLYGCLESSESGIQPVKCVLCLVSCLKSVLSLYLDSFSASSSAEWIPSFFNSSTRSPFWCIWSRMSQPPTNSPLKYTWGIVGQLEKSLTPVEGRQH